MRISSELQAFFNDQGMQEKVTFMREQFGGWERWFQMEFAYSLQEKYKDRYAVLLEVKDDYTNNLDRTDIHLYANTIHQRETMLELKCETPQTKNLGRLMDADIQKRAQKKEQNVDFEAVAIAISEENLHTAYSTLRKKYHESIMVYQNPDWPIAGILVYVE